MAAQENRVSERAEASDEKIDRLQAIDHLIELRLNAVLGRRELECLHLHEVTDGSLSFFHFDLKVVYVIGIGIGLISEQVSKLMLQRVMMSAGTVGWEC